MASRLREFEDILLKLCQASLAAPDAESDACAQLIQDVVAHGRGQFVESLTQTPGENEYRLNGAGLKLAYEVETYRDGEQMRVYVGKLKIDGDEARDYPGFVRAAQPILQFANATPISDGVTRAAG
jgi:hypothetical protein